jgi:hypothetical protein
MDEKYEREDNLKRWFIFLSVALLLSILSACGSESTQPSLQVDGPALVMFYTDN